MATAETLKGWIPVAVLAIGLVGTFVRAEDQIADNSAEIEDLSESVDEAEGEINALQFLLLEQQSEQKQEITEIQGDIKLILRLLQENGQ